MMMEEIKNATNAELEQEAARLENKFNETKYLISTLWEELGPIVEEYERIMEEIDRRNGKQI